MRFLNKVIASCSSRTGVPTPRDEAEVPLNLRNPYGSTFLERLLSAYQSPPTGHPYNKVEKAFTPDLLQAIERERMMPESEKVANILKRDMRWFDGVRAQPKDITRGG